MAISPFRTSFSALAGSLAGGGSAIEKHVKQKNKNALDRFGAELAKGELFSNIIGKGDTNVKDTGKAMSKLEAEIGMAEAGQKGENQRAGARETSSIHRQDTTNITADRASRRSYLADVIESKRRAQENSVTIAEQQRINMIGGLRKNLQNMLEKNIADLRDAGYSEEELKKAVPGLRDKLFEVGAEYARWITNKQKADFDRNTLAGGMTSDQYHETLKQNIRDATLIVEELTNPEKVAAQRAAEQYGVNAGRAQASAQFGDLLMPPGGGGSGGANSATIKLGQIVQARLNQYDNVLDSKDARKVNTAILDADAFFFDDSGLKDQFKILSPETQRSILAARAALGNRLEVLTKK